MFGGLHVEMTLLKIAGEWLDKTGWTEALELSGIATEGSADSFTKGSHVTKCRHAHQVTAAALYILQHMAYDMYCETVLLGEPSDFNDGAKKCVMINHNSCSGTGHYN